MTFEERFWKYWDWLGAELDKGRTPEFQGKGNPRRLAYIDGQRLAVQEFNSPSARASSPSCGRRTLEKEFKLLYHDAEVEKLGVRTLRTRYSGVTIVGLSEWKWPMFRQFKYNSWLM